MVELDIVTNVISTLIECTIYTAILNAYWKYESKYRYVVSTLAAALFFVVGFFFSDSPVLQMVLGVVVIIGYSMIVMRGGLWQSITIALVLLVNTLLVNLATSLCVEILSWYRGAEQIINTTASKMAYVAFNRIVFIIIFYIWGRVLAKRRIIKKEEWLMLAVYFIADSVAAVALILWTYVRHFDGRDYIYVLAIEIAIIVMTVVPLAIANSISYKNDYEKRNELANLKLQAQRADIIRMDKAYQDIRKIRHDMVKHLNIYMHLLNDGDYEGLRQAIGEHIEDCGQNKYVYVAGNNLVNSVLNEKKVLCEHENIKMQVEVTASVDGERELDIAVMLSNLLDNAVEAQKKITQDKPRSIFLKIFSYENKYSILIKNTVAKSVLQNNPRFITDKTNRYLHGIGMKSIEHTVDKNGGYIQRYEEDGMFCVHILL